MIDASSASAPAPPSGGLTADQRVRFTHAVRQELLGLVGVKRAEIWRPLHRLASALADAVRLVARHKPGPASFCGFDVLKVFVVLGDERDDVWHHLQQLGEAEPPLAGEAARLFSALCRIFVRNLEPALRERGRLGEGVTAPPAHASALAERLVRAAMQVEGEPDVPSLATLTTWACDEPEVIQDE